MTRYWDLLIASERLRHTPHTVDIYARYHATFMELLRLPAPILQTVALSRIDFLLSDAPNPFRDDFTPYLPLEAILERLERTTEPKIIAKLLLFLGATRQHEVSPILLSYREYDEWNVRAAAYVGLGKLGEQAPLDTLQLGLADPSARVRKAAFRALANREPPAPPKLLLPYAHDPHLGQDARRSLILQNRRDPAAIVRQLLRDAVDDAERYQIVWTCIWNTIYEPADALVGVLLTHLAAIHRVWEGTDDEVSDTLRMLRHLAHRVPPDIPLSILREDLGWDSVTEAARLLGVLRVTEAAPDLMRVMRQHVKYVRRAALEALADIQGAAVAPLALELLRDQSADVRASAARLLRRFDPDMSFADIACLVTDRNAEARDAAMVVLRELHAPNLLKIAQGLILEEDRSLQAEGLGILASLGDAGVPALLALLDGPESDITPKVMHALEPFSQHIPFATKLNFTTHANQDMRRNALALFDLSDGSVALEIILDALAEGDQIKGNYARSALRRWPQIPLEPLVALSEHPRDQTRVHAAQVLEYVGPDAIPTLTHLLRDPAAEVRDAAAKSLHYLDAPLPTADLLELFEVYAPAPSAIAWMLRKHPERWEVADILLLLAHPQPQTRIVGIEILDERVTYALLAPLLDDSDAAVRAAATLALGKLGADAPFEALTRLCNAEESSVAHNAARALGMVAAFAPAPLLEAVLVGANIQAQQTAIRAILANPARFTPDVLRRLLLTAEPQLRMRLIQTLSLSDSPHERLEHRVADATLRAILSLPDWRDREQMVASALKLWASRGYPLPADVLSRALAETNFQIHQGVIRCAEYPDSGVPVAVALQALETPDDYGYMYSTALHVLRVRDVAPPLVILRRLLNLSRISREACAALQQWYPEAVPAICAEMTAVLAGDDAAPVFPEIMQRSVAEALGEIGQRAPEVYAILASYLESPFATVQKAALTALETLRRNVPDATIRRIMALRQAGATAGVRAAADLALASILSLESGIEDD